MHQEFALRAIAEALDEHLDEIYGSEMGFILLVAKQNSAPGMADYISNSCRDDCIKWLRETADRLEQNEVIPATQGEA